MTTAGAFPTATVVHDPVWHEDVSVLFKRWYDFFPCARHTTAERVNAVVRFCAYAGLLLYIHNRRAKYIVFGLVAGAIVTLAHNSKLIHSAEDELELRQASCVRPTPDNPFANFLITDDPSRLPACPFESTADLTRQYFNQGLPRNLEDYHEKENSQRQFIRMPVTESVPNTKVFRDFLYAHAPSCKENATVCTGYN